MVGLIYYSSFSYLYTRYMDFGDLEGSSSLSLTHCKTEYPNSTPVDYHVLTRDDLERRSKIYAQKRIEETGTDNNYVYL